MLKKSIVFTCNYIILTLIFKHAHAHHHHLYPLKETALNVKPLGSNSMHGGSQFCQKPFITKISSSSLLAPTGAPLVTVIYYI